MARTAVPYSNLAGNSSILEPTPTTADTTNDHVVNAAVPERTILRVYNTSGSTKTVTIKAGDYPPALAAGQGDLVVSVADSAIRLIGPLESGRFKQSNGTLEIDLEAGYTGSITALLLPKSV